MAKHMDTSELDSVTNSRRKPRMLKVKDPQALQKNIREGKERILEEEQDQQLINEVTFLRNKLNTNQQLLNDMEREMETRISKFNEDVELGKQRENKLMFFLYVLKEEKKCPVTEVFDDYIKPIETARFTADYGEDYRKVLRKIKK